MYNSTDAISSSEATQSVGVSTDLQGIAALLSNFATTLNKGVSLQEEDLDPYFANNFGMDDGLDRALMIDDWRGNASGCDNCISSISGVAIKEKKDNGDYVIAAVFYTSDGSVYPGVEFTVTREDNAWRFKGNGYKSSIDIYPITEKYFDSNGRESSVVSGIRFDVDDNGNNGLHYVIITGPGLPEEGIEMAKGTPDVVDMEPVNWGQGDFYHVYPMSDTTIGTLDEINLTYTVVVYDTQGELVETRTRTLPKRPYKVSEVDASYFLQISGIPDHNTNSLHFDGETLSFTYTTPTAYQVSGMDMEVGYWGSGGWETMEKSLSPNDTSASIVTLGLPDGFDLGGGWLRSDVNDMYGRDITVSWQFSPTSTTPFEGAGKTVSKSSIVGSWGDGVTGSDVISLTFYADGTYIHWQTDDDGCSTCIGVEYGTYGYDSVKQVLTVTPTVDENGYYGLSNPSSDSVGGVGQTVTWPVTVSGDTMTVTIRDLNDQPYAASTKRVVDANKPIVGSWEHDHIESWVVDPNDKGSLTFYANGTYINWEDADTYCGHTGTGVEYGTYSYDVNSKTLTVTATVDENGDCGGFTHIAGQSNSISGFSVSGDIMKFEHSDGKTDTFKRVEEPPAILGTWYGGNPTTRDFGSVTFFDDGTYIIAEDGVADSDGQAGMEHGTYTWDPATGVFTASASLEDTSGDWGLSHLMGGDTITISGNTLTINATGDGMYTATRLLPDADNPIVGTWYGGDPNIFLFYLMSFFADGTYIMADNDDTTINTDPDNPICHPGMELGTYTWNPVTGAFSAKSIYSDTNGECGFTTGDGDGIGETATVTINGNTMTMDFGDSAGVHQITRVVP